MKHRPLALVAAAIPLLAGCASNSSVGNDREAQLDPPRAPAEVMAAGSALAGIATELVVPQIMTAADLTNTPEVANGCTFRYTSVGEPVVLYGSQAVVKLNGKLVPLPASGSGTYAADGVSVTVVPLAGTVETAEPFEAEFVLRLPGAPDELGFHGFSECGGR